MFYHTIQINSGLNNEGDILRYRILSGDWTLDCGVIVLIWPRFANERHHLTSAFNERKEERLHDMPKQKIMVVEDEETLLRLESHLLTSRGYHVCGMHNGEEALKCIGTEMPDLVLLDVMMPGIDGFEVCRQIKSNISTSHIPVVLLTAKKGEEDIAMGVSVKADRYITKPFRVAILIETIQGFLGKGETWH